MGRLPHPVHVISAVNGRRRPLGVVDIGYADPDSSMLDVCSRLITILEDPNNRVYLELEVAYAKTLPEEVWSQDLEKELERLQAELYNLPTAEIRSKRKEFFRKSDEARMPMFPAIQTCLYLGAVWTGYGDYIHNVGLRPWNSAFDWHGLCEPGCLILDITDPSRVAYCFLLPAEDSFHDEVEDPEGHARYEKRQMVPLPGFEWLAAFDLRDKSTTVRGTGDSKPAPLIHAQSLHEAWPSFPKPDGMDLDDNKTNRFNGQTQDGHYNPDAEVIRKLLYCEKISLNRTTRAFKSRLKTYLFEHPEELTSNTPRAVQLLLAVLKPKKQVITLLRLHQFVNLSGDQIVQLVRGLIPHNRAKKALTLLDVSFNRGVTVKHLSQILNLVSIHELIFWDNPNLILEEVTKLVRSTGRVKKLTTRGLFMEAFERWLIPNQGPHRHLATPRGPIKQLVWVNAMTQSKDDTTMMSGSDPPVFLRLEHCDVQKLAEILDPKRIFEHCTKDNFAFAESMTFPLHDSWTTLPEFFISCSRMEEFIARCDGDEFGIHDIVARYPLQVPLMIATGNPKSKTAISPFPAEAFGRAVREVNNPNPLKRELRTRRPGLILPGEYTMMVVHERDIGRLSYGIATRNAEGTMEIHDPEVLAKTLGDVAAGKAWRAGIGNLPKWTEEERDLQHGTDFLHRRAALLTTNSAENIYNAARLLANEYKCDDDNDD